MSTYFYHRRKEFISKFTTEKNVPTVTLNVECKLLNIPHHRCWGTWKSYFFNNVQNIQDFPWRYNWFLSFLQFRSACWKGDQIKWNTCWKQNGNQRYPTTIILGRQPSSQQQGVSKGIPPVPVGFFIHVIQSGACEIHV